MRKINLVVAVSYGFGLLCRGRVWRFCLGKAGQHPARQG